MDHVRGSSLAWPESLETLRPFILTWWSGRSVRDMPPEVRALYDEAGFGNRPINLALVVLNPQGKVIRSSVPSIQPGAFRFDPSNQGRDFKDQLDELISGLTLPTVKQPAKPKWTLPDITTKGQPAGVRIFLKFANNRLNHFRTPVIEAVTMTDELRTALGYPSKVRWLEVASLQPWLEQMYPPAIMDGKGGFHKITGELSLSPANWEGSSKGPRFAILEGDVWFFLDNQSRTTYQGSLQVALEYRGDGPDLYALRGVMEAVVPKGPERILMTAAIESRPK